MARTRRLRLRSGQYVKLDQRDWRWAKDHFWHAVAGMGYARRTYRVDGAVHHPYMHREIYERILGRKIPKHMVIDHINRDPHDNRRCNLRMVSIKTNNWNRNNILLWDGERWVFEPHGMRTVNGNWDVYGKGA